MRGGVQEGRPQDEKKGEISVKELVDAFAFGATAEGIKLKDEWVAERAENEMKLEPLEQRLHYRCNTAGILAGIDMTYDARKILESVVAEAKTIPGSTLAATVMEALESYPVYH